MFEVHKSRSHKTVHGIKGLSVLTGVPNFNIVDGLPVDYMHMALLGVTRTIWELLLENTGFESKEQPYYIGHKRKMIESRLLNIRLPSSFPRRLRKIEEYTKYKASEWEAILLHCIYPCLSDLLPSVYLKHIMLFASTMFLLLEFNIQEHILSLCEKQLIKFVYFEKLYGKPYMVYNVHISKHLVNAVRNLGALWNFSLFPYENDNGMLTAFHSSNNHPVLQVATKFFLNKLVHHTQLPINSPIFEWTEKLWSLQAKSLKYDARLKTTIENNVTVADHMRETDFNDIGKCQYEGINICAKEICRKFAYDDSYVCLNGMFYHVERFLVDKKEKLYIIGTQMLVKKLFANMFLYTFSKNMILLLLNESVRQCVSVTVETVNGTYKNYVSFCKIRTQID
ncbi:uncharacterized protein LOC129717849 isoform X1 [Wyeomyia smithii]|uniref:uncharacterized protein LOC129717849 isoform X1 n=1 Tax=Wyeomyia smithii TaxID=174621 RepID=UPI002467B743|nr:uncharacterized protein LOC129717849 isoform X1 [Wyeomyia smithii]